MKNRGWTENEQPRFAFEQRQQVRFRGGGGRWQIERCPHRLLRPRIVVAAELGNRSITRG